MDYLNYLIGQDCLRVQAETGRRMRLMSDRNKRDQIKAKKPDATAEERAISGATGATGSGETRQWNAWEGDAEYQKAHAAAPQADKDQAEAAAKNQTRTPEAPGADTATHGGSGAPPSVDPKVADLLESGKDLYVDGQNQLREVEPDKNR